MNKPKILIAEDDCIMALELQETLQELGYDVPELVCSGKDVIEMSKKINPDLIIMDIRLKGGIDGIEAVTKIHSFSNVPILFLSGYADKGTLEKIKESGAVGFIGKPFDTARLKSTIKMILGAQR